MSNWLRRGGKSLPRTADTGSDYPTPESGDEPEDEARFEIADLPGEAWPTAEEAAVQDHRFPQRRGRVMLEIIEASGNASPTATAEDNWQGPEWGRGASIAEFVRYLSPDIWRRLLICHADPWKMTRENWADYIRKSSAR